MRRWTLSGLYLLWGLLAARADAEEIQWHAAAQASGQSASLPASPSSVVTLARPVPNVSRVAGSGSDKITRVSYETTAPDTPRPVVRFQRSDAAQPLPPGPALNGEEMLGPPRPLSTGKTITPVPAGSDIISRWIGETPDYVPGAMPGGGVMGHGPYVANSSPCDCGGDSCCGPICCDPCGPVCCDPCCGPICCDPCCGTCCADRGRFWFSGEYLLWAFKRDTLPPLVTGNALGLPAALTTPGTVVLFGDNGTDNKDFSGGRFTIGYWCCHCPDLGIEGSYFFLGQLNKTFAIGSNGMTSLGRPLNVVNSTLDSFGNIVPPGENVEIVSLGSTSGSVMVQTASRLWGAELNGRYKLCCGDCWHVDLLAGFRYVDLQESVNITENLNSPGGIGGLAGGSTTNIIVSDRFGTHDQFYGGQIGLDTELRWRRWFLGGTFKVALGDMSEQVRIGGNTVFTPAGGTPIPQNGGVLALASNIGTFTKNRFAVVPEVGLKFGLQVTDHMRIFAGYNFLYLSDVVRPGDQIDRRVNTNQFPSVFGGTTLAQPALPAALFKTTDFWAQGLTAGMEFRY
jgi:hypothetical protein